MFFLELALQGVRGCSPSVRVALKPGYTVLAAPSGAPTLGSLVAALAYADGRGGDAALAQPGQKARAAVTFQGNDQNVYRIARELGGGGALQRLDRATNQFAVVTQDAAEALQFLRSQAGLPTRSAFDQVFSLTTAQLPTRRPKRSASPGAAAGSRPPLAPSASAIAPADDVVAAQAKVAELEKELTLSRGVEKVQFRVDELASELYEAESKLKGSEGLKDALRRAEAAWKEAPTPESLGLPKDIVSRVERYPQLMAKRDEALARVQTEREQAQAQEAPAAPEPLYRDQRFLLGIVAGAACFASGLFFEGYGRYLTLLNIPAFGFAALVAIKWVEGLQASTRTSRKGEFLAAREKKIHEEFEREARHVREALKAGQVESPQELVDVLARRSLLHEKVEDFRAQLSALEADPEHAAASQRVAELKAEHDRLVATLQQKGSYVRDVREVERELDRVKQSIKLATEPPASRPPAGPAVTSPAVASAAEALEDPHPALMKQAADLLVGDVPAAGALVKDRCAQYLAALTDRRYIGVEFDRDGWATALSATGRARAGALPPEDLDLVYLSVRLAVVEKLSPRVKVPLVVDDLLGAIDERRHGLLVRMLKHLGTLTQVLHVTQSPVAAQVADASGRL